MSKRILVAAGLYPPDIGGPATYARMIEERLPEHNISVTILPFGQVRLLPPIIRHFVYAYRLWRLAPQHEAIYALDSISVGLPAWLVCVIRRKPLIIRLGGDYAWEQGSQRFALALTLDEYSDNRKLAGLRVRILAWLQDLVVSRARLVIVPSNYLRNIVTTWPGVINERVQVIHSALFPLLAEADRTDLRSQLNYQGLVIVSAGRLVPWKGFSVLLQSVASVAQTLPEVTLVIAGDGPLRTELQAQAHSLDISLQVRFVGSLSKEALGAAIKAADMFVLNTGYEGLSHQLLEVMDLGVPIITTNIGGNPELISNMQNGLLVPYNDVNSLTEAIIKLNNDPALQKQFVIEAKGRVKNFLPEVVIRQLVDCINQIY